MTLDDGWRYGFQHQTALTNERITLCQEWSMRTGEYDDRALVNVERGEGAILMRPFSTVVFEIGLDAAVRAVHVCLWQAADEHKAQGWPPCPECAEVAHS